MAERCASGMTELMMAERHVSGTVQLTMAERCVLGTTELMMAERCVSGTIELTMAERRVSGMTKLMMVERCVSSTIKLTMVERCTSGTTELMMADRHVSGTIELTMTERRVSGIIDLTMAERRVLGAMDLNVLRKKPRMSGWKSAPAAGPEGAQPEVEVTHTEASAKRPAGSPIPNQTVASRPEKDLCGMRVQEDDEGYYVLQMADWAPRDSSAAMRARWPNLSYQTRVWDDPEVASEFDRGVLHLMLAKDLYTLPSEVLIARAAKQIMLADNAKLKSGLDELSSWLDKADKELNKLREGLAESQRQLKEQKVDRCKADDELLKLMRENESLKAELSGKSIANYRHSVGLGWGL
ncbi:hypothetical protein B296_00025729 [Ensete ventricosum]|uniref:Uncharacterized protein n=1 Tax=Ensete ventricosum TaxID=4639 RepID=A0A426YSE3_ENSVE|nr:hypothetical protein B296_00025729 [Ensete ventricosum]